MPDSISRAAPLASRPLLRLQTLSRGEGLLGMRPHGRLGPRAEPLSLMWLCHVDARGRQRPSATSPDAEGPGSPEHAALQRLLALGAQVLRADHLQWRASPPNFAAPLWTLEREADFGDFLADEVPKLREAGWEVEVLPGFAHLPQPLSGWSLSLSEEEAAEAGVGRLGAERRQGSWLLSLGVMVEGERLDLAPLIANLLRRDRRWLTLASLDAIEDDARISLRAPGGRRFHCEARVLKQLLRPMLHLLNARQLAAGGPVRLNEWDAAQLGTLDQPDGRWQIEGRDGLRALARRLQRAGSPPPVEAPSGLGLTLRPYQLQGLAWLHYLGREGLGGILADEMGLGKTAQLLAHLLREKQQGRLTRPALVVVPTSLLFNWEAEAARISPGLRVVRWQGPLREASTLPDADLLLCSYALVWRDLRPLSRQPWSWLVLDEAQAVKNPMSRAARALRRLSSEHRLVLSGTPVENHLGELWAHFDFLMPGFLGDVRGFARHWRKPIEEGGEGQRARELAARVRPFILRRVKETVAAELPPRTELIQRLSLAGDQLALYESVRVAADHLVRRILSRQANLDGQLISVLDALLRLRQVCCDPRLLAGMPQAQGVGSAKLDWLRAQLPLLLAQGRRVLVFSQFASLLDLVERALADQGQACLRLSGETPEQARGELVRRFQAGEHPLMLLSLKAGGVGLNLTAADTVIHLDPWWNPAVQEQASARAHRLGQDKPVFVIQLLVAGSIEERMLALQQRKRGLADGVLGEDGAALLGKFSANELSALLAPLETAGDESED